jgi:hypothetical protein
MTHHKYVREGRRERGRREKGEGRREQEEGSDC